MTVPTWAEIRQALILAAVTFACTFVSGLILSGQWEFSAALLAAEAGIAAALAFLGWEGYLTTRKGKP